VNAADAAILGLVQGLTEFLPVSSTAHLLVAQEWLGVNQKGLQLEVATHVGTVLAVLVYYRRLFAEHLRDTFRGGPGRRLVGLVALATLMLGVVAVVYKAFPQVKEWRDDVRVVPFGLVAVGLFMVATAFVRRGGAEPSARTSCVMGLAQCAAAILPGCSRSGSTIGSGLVLGLDPAQAARFSFLMSVPAVLVGAAKDAADEGLPALSGAGPLAIALVVSFASGLLAIHAMLTIVGRGKLHWFGPYCVLLGIVVWFVTK
jgi:undecaprenyl-diphosphatase